MGYRKRVATADEFLWQADDGDLRNHASKLIDIISFSLTESTPPIKNSGWKIYAM